jgi:pilus assembly protein CpaF
MKQEEVTQIISDVKNIISESLDFSRDIDDDDVKKIITDIVFTKTDKYYIGIAEKIQLINRIFNSLRRLDILQPLIDDKTITEIMVNGTENIFIETGGKILETKLKFESRERLEDVIQSIVSRTNRTVNEYSPIVDTRLEDGSRVNVVLPPAAINGPIMTIRKFPEKPMTMEDLIKLNSLSDEAAAMLERMVKARCNIFICGGTGSGKTTFLNVLSNFIPKDERIITIEDSAELQITGVKNLVRLETRDANTEGKGRITIRDLIRTSLRMRPERIIVGEVRGAEALDMLQAMNTGHDGSISTGHANSPQDMLNRLETMVMYAASLPLDAIRQQIASSIDFIIHLSRLRDHTRRVIEITEVGQYKDGKISLNSLFTFEERGECKEGKIIGTLKRTNNAVLNTAKFKLAGMVCEA